MSKRLLILCAALIIMISVQAHAKKNSVINQPIQIVEYSSDKQFNIKKNQAPKFSFAYPDNFHVHSYDGSSINLNDWRNPDLFNQGSVIIRWRKAPFNVKEETMYLKMGQSKSNVKMIKTSIKPVKAKKVWAYRAQYDYDNKFSVPVSPPETYKNGKALTIRPTKAVLDETVMTVRCGPWNVLIDYKARAEEQYKETQANIENLAKSFKCS